MFFADNLLTDKKSPRAGEGGLKGTTLGIAWLAATLGPKNANKRVTRKELSKYDLVNACEYISEPPEPLALRTSGILLYGVARVYNQHYEEFQHHVTRFHSDVQRAIQTNFATTVNGRIAGNQGIDLLDDGKSKLDAITFAGIDFGWQSGIDFEMRFINWNDPLGDRNRRESSKLDSQLSQTTMDEDEGGSEDDEEGTQEGGRAGKLHKMSSPFGLDPKRRSPHIGSDRRSHDMLEDPVFNGDVELFNLDDIEGLGLPDMPGADPNSSFSVPDPMGDGDITMDMQMDEAQFGQDPLRAGTPPPAGATTSRASKSARKRQSSTDELSEVEEVVGKKKKAKKAPKVKMDKNLEMADESEAASRARYRAQMEDEKKAGQEKNKDTELSGRAVGMVDAAGGWMDFMDTDMQDLFQGISKVDKFKWELDLAAHKLGSAYVPEDEDEEDENTGRSRTKRGAEGEAEVFGEYVGNGLGQEAGGMDDPFMEYTNNDTTEYQDLNHDFMEPLHDPSSRPIRDDSADIEAVRRMSQTGRVSLPWDNKSVNDLDDMPGGFDSSFDAPSLHLTNMTPQEARLRLSSKSLSKTASLDALVRRARSRSGSVLDGKASKPAQMLFGGEGEDEDSLPQDIRDMADEPSQYLQLPDAYRPEMLAMLDLQCRNFLQFVEGRMIKAGDDEVEFEDLCPPDKTKKTVACQAFYNVLNLTTKKILKVDQATPFESFSIQFTAQLKI